MTKPVKSAFVFASRLGGLRLNLPEGTVQFQDGRYETDSKELAAGIERAAANDPNLAIQKENL